MKVKKDMMMAELIPDIIPEEKKPLEPPTGMDEEFSEVSLSGGVYALLDSSNSQSDLAKLE